MRKELLSSDWPSACRGLKHHSQFTRNGGRASTRRVSRHQCLPHRRRTSQARLHTTANMPHSVTPDSTPVDDSSRTISQVDTVKSEPESQDVAMDDAPSPAVAAAEKPKVNLEDLFDDSESDGEFPSSAPVKSEEESSQPAPLYAPTDPLQKPFSD